MDDGIQAQIASVEARCKSNSHRIDELEAEMKQLKSLSAVETGAARSLYILRAEQLDVISGKLRTAIEAGDKRIEIKY